MASWRSCSVPDPRCRIRPETIRIKASADTITSDDLMTLAISHLQMAADLIAEVGYDPARGSKFARVIVRAALDDIVAAGSLH